MRDSALLTFQLSEYEIRLKKLLNKMDEEEITAVVLASDENTNYFTGFKSIVWDSKVATPVVLVINNDGSTLVTTTGGNAQTAFHTSCADEVRIYGNKDYKTLADCVKSMVKDCGKVGFELGDGHKIHLNHSNREAVFDKIGRENICDAGDIIWEIRSLKSQNEIDAIRKACEINCEAIESSFKELHEGMTEMELYQNIMSKYFKLGAEFALNIGVRAGKKRYSQANCPPSYTKIGKGDIILVDGGPIYKGYYSDIIREAVISQPTDRQMDMFNVARDACNAGIAHIKPGVNIKEICEVVQDVLLTSEYADFTSKSGWCGHSIGVGVHEYPMLDPSYDVVLREGMVFAIEPYFYEDKVGSLGIEENIAVTADGCDILSKSDSSLMIL